MHILSHRFSQGNLDSPGWDRANWAKTLLCICKLTCYRHVSVPVSPPILQTCLKACKIGNSALIWQSHLTKIDVFWNPRGWGNTLVDFILRSLGLRICQQIRVLNSTKRGEILVPIVGRIVKIHITKVCFRTLSFLAIFI